MTQEDKELLLKDLCARLPYGVKVQYYDNETKKLETGTIVSCTIPIDETNKKYPTFITRRDLLIIQGNTIEDCKPYLFPISSITEEQWKEITDIQIQESLKSLDSIDDSMSNPLFSTDDLKTIEWCYANYIDIHNLIPMGLAYDATGLNIY